MGQKRKRPVKNGGAPSSQICSNLSFRSDSAPSRGEPVQHPHPVISLYYRQVLTLRQFLLQQLPSTSKARRRRILSLKPSAAKTDGDENAAGQKPGSGQNPASLLDTTLVGVPKKPVPTVDNTRQRDFIAFTQSQERPQSTDTGAPCPQAEVILSFYSALLVPMSK